MKRILEMLASLPNKECRRLSSDGQVAGISPRLNVQYHQVEGQPVSDDRWYSAGVTEAIAKERDELHAEVERLREANRWIPCSERLPTVSDGLWVLIHVNDPNPDNKPFTTLAAYFPDSTHEHKWSDWDGEDFYRTDDVIGWRPLPDPPEVTK